jgi:hypothetical protein
MTTHTVGGTCDRRRTRTESATPPGWRSAVIRRRPPPASSLGKGARIVLGANLGDVLY